MLWGNEVEDDPLTPTPLTHIAPIKNNNTPFAKVINYKNLPRKQTMRKKLPLEEPSLATPFSKGKK